MQQILVNQNAITENRVVTPSRAAGHLGAARLVESKALRLRRTMSPNGSSGAFSTTRAMACFFTTSENGWGHCGGLGHRQSR